MTTRKLSLLFVLIAAVALQACAPAADVAGLVATGIAGTQQASGLLTEAAAANQPAPTNTPEAAAPTPEPTAEPTQAVSAPPQSSASGAVVTVARDTNCRSGPGTQYTWRGVFRAGQQTQVLKVYSGGDYVVVVDPSGEGECWLWLGYASPTSFEGYGLAEAVRPPVPVVLTPAPTPTPVYIWDGDWTIRVIDTATQDKQTGTISFRRSGEVITGSVQVWPSGLIYEFAGSMMPGHVKVAGDYIQGATSLGWSATMSSNLMQFSGNLHGVLELCGWRTGSHQPAQCFMP